MNRTYNLPAESATGVKTTVAVVVEDAVVNAVAAARATGEFDEDVYCKTLTGFTKAQLTVAFEVVQNRDHWKNPIDVMVDDSAVAVTVEAIKFFHASSPKVTPLGEGKTRIKGIGYAA